MAKKCIVIGNWKMHPSSGKEAIKWFKSLAKLVTKIRQTEVVVCPPVVYLDNLKKVRTSKIKLGAQDLFFGDVGPNTGAISGAMLEDMGIKYSILGHSERRALGESDELINKKIKSALAFGITPILCVGEKDRDPAHNYFEVVKNQIGDCLRGISKDSLSRVMIAYEPIWSISSTENRKDATPGDIHEMSLFVRKVLSDLATGTVASKMHILYGGSVNSKDALDFYKQGEVDGLLVGKSSLDPVKFFEIIQICETSNK